MKLLSPVITTLALACSLAPVPSSAQATANVRAPDTPREALAVTAFWREAGPAKWFAKDPAFDRAFRERFLPLYEQAAQGRLAHWSRTVEGSLALILLLDQFPRNAFRGSARAYATDSLAVQAANRAIQQGVDMALDPSMRLFIYLPFGHAENLALQERSVALSRHLGAVDQHFAKGHRDIIQRFGRFPHRNAVLGRPMRPEEQKFLDEGGFSG